MLPYSEFFAAKIPATVEHIAQTRSRNIGYPRASTITSQSPSDI